MPTLLLSFLRKENTRHAIKKKRFEKKEKASFQPLELLYYFFPFQVFFHDQCVTLKFQIKSETCFNKSESIFNFELFYASAYEINQLFFMGFRRRGVLQCLKNILTKANKLRRFGQPQENLTPVFTKFFTVLYLMKILE